MKNNFNFFLFLSIFKKYIFKLFILSDNTIKCIINSSFLYLFNLFLNKSFLFQVVSFVDLCCIDKLYNTYRFELNYNLLSYFYKYRLFLVCLIKITLQFPYGMGIRSLTSLYKSSGWLEREVWDLFGIFFKNHIDLRRILTDYGFFGFAFRKDFPLVGFKEIKYDEINKIVISENLLLTQDFRVFTFMNPW